MRTLLTDDEYVQFLTQGYVIVQPTSLGQEFHDHLWNCADRLYTRAGKLGSKTAHLELLGDNLRALVPEIDQVLTEPAVAGTITSILGEDAFLHPHCYVHESTTSDQPFHQDGNLPWNERGHYRSHRCDWLILLYYPQEVTADNGPTEILPYSQYWTIDIEKPDGDWRRGDLIDPDLDRELLASTDLVSRDQALTASVDKLRIPNIQRRTIQVPRGAVFIGNYDLIHRGTRKLPEQPARYMYKFFYARTRAPKQATWNHQQSELGLQDVRKDLQPIVEVNWAWGNGQRLRRDLEQSKFEAVLTALTEGGENEKVAAAYLFGMDTTSRSLNGLLSALQHPQESTRRAAAYGLRHRSDEANKELIKALHDSSVSVRRFASFALGSPWSQGEKALIERLASEPDDLARSNAAYALGQVARNPEANAEAILTALLARLQPGVEPDNTNVAGLSRSTVRQSVAYAILQLAANHPITAERRSDLGALLGIERDRYIVSMLAEAIAHSSPDAGAIRTLAAQRWSSV